MVRLKVARVIRGLSQIELGMKVGMSASTVSLVERGYRIPSKAEKQQLAEALNMRPDQITWPSPLSFPGDQNGTEAAV